jgi:hypothetical protein
MTATMIKIERNEKLESAIIRCKAIHPKVRKVAADTFEVTGKNGAHTVRIITPKANLILAECDCRGFGGRKATVCYHCCAALSFISIGTYAKETAPVAVPAPTPNAGILVKRERGGMRVDGWMV